MFAGGLTLAKADWRKPAERMPGGPAARHHASHDGSLTRLMLLSDWYWFVPETVGLLAAIWLARPLFAADLAGLPHPFWIPVLLMSAQYGIMGGLFAALAATSMFFAAGLPPQSASQDFYAYAGIVAAQPCAWFGSALILGALRSLHLHNQNDLQERLDQTALTAEDLADGLNAAASEIDRLEQRIATDCGTVSSFLDGLAKLDLRDRRSLAGGFVDIIRLGVGATSFAIFLEDGGWLEPCVGVEDGARLSPDLIEPLTPSMLASLNRDTNGSDAMRNMDAGEDPGPIWAPISLLDSPRCTGVVVCHHLQPARDQALAGRRLNEVCRVLAVLLSAYPSTSDAACGDDRSRDRPRSAADEHKPPVGRCEPVLS